MNYQWKSGSRINGISAQVAGEVCEQLEQENRLTAGTLVDVSRPEQAPLHPAFEWNDRTAAEEYRKEQARHIINCIVVQTEKPDVKPVRVFFKVEQETNNYEHIATIIKSEDKRAKLLKQAFDDLDAVRNKYNTLQEMDDIFASILDRKKDLLPEQV